MNVAELRRLVDVNEPGRVPELATEVAPRWNGGGVASLRGSANHICRFVRGGQPAFLRLSSASAGVGARRRSSCSSTTSLAAGYAEARPLPAGEWEALPRLLALVTGAKVAQVHRADRASRWMRTRRPGRGRCGAGASAGSRPNARRCDGRRSESPTGGVDDDERFS